jgi:hypothetical protein
MREMTFYNMDSWGREGGGNEYFIFLKLFQQKTEMGNSVCWVGTTTLSMATLSITTLSIMTFSKIKIKM